MLPTLAEDQQLPPEFSSRPSRQEHGDLSLRKAGIQDTPMTRILTSSLPEASHEVTTNPQ